VTLVATLSSSYKLTIIRDPDILQPADYPANDRFPAATHEEALDRATMIMQRLKDYIDRSFRLSDGDVSGISLILSNLGAGKLIAVNAAGDGIESIAAADVDLVTVSAYIQTLLNDADAATARATLGLVIGTDVAAMSANTFTGLQQLDYSANIASGATVDLGTATGNSVTVTHSSGTTAITSFGGAATAQKGTIIAVIPSISGGTLTVTHHATNMILLGAANITLASGDVLLMMKNHDSNAEWKHVGGWKADGTAWVEEDSITLATGTSLSGTNVDITGIPAGTNEVVLHIASMSTNGTSLPLLVLGDSGGFETSNYIGANSMPYAGPNWLGNTFSAAFELTPVIVASTVFSGMIILRRLGGNFWSVSWNLALSSSPAVSFGAGYKQLSDELTQVRLIMANATDTFDSGSVTPTYMT
jgi:hypothetical protein